MEEAKEERCRKWGIGREGRKKRGFKVWCLINKFCGLL